MLINVKGQLAAHEAEHEHWEINCRLPHEFDDLVLRDHAWKLETAMDLRAEGR